MAQVGDDPQRLAAASRVLWDENKDMAGAITCALRVASHLPDLGATLLGQLERAYQESDVDDVPEMTQLHAVLSQNAETRLAALNNWGAALADQAETEEGEDADRLFEEAGRKYAEALRLKPDFPEALGNWGNALYNQAKTKDGEEADRLFNEASRKLAEHVGRGAYNLACSHARTGDTRGAVRQLQVCESVGERLPGAKIAAEKDFDHIRN